VKINKSYKSELKPNNKQASLFEKAFGTSRFTFNWGLNLLKQSYENHKLDSSKPKYLSFYDLSKILNSKKKSEFPWIYKVSKCVPQEALSDLDSAFKNFFRRVKNKETPGFPKFKSKHGSKQSFRISNAGPINITESHIQIPKIGWVRLKQKNYFPVSEHKTHKIFNLTVSKENYRYFVSVQTELHIPEPKALENPPDILGIDRGLKTLLVCSDGTSFDNPKTYNKYEKKLKHAQRNLSRKQKGSNNREKAIKVVSKIHYKIRNIRKNIINKITSTLVKTKPKVFVIEDLGIGNMVKNRNLAKSIMDAGWGMFRTMLEYKCFWYGGSVRYVDRFYPSSKLCSRCGNKKEHLDLSERTYHCELCSFEMDRDLNAAKNLAQAYSLGKTRASSVRKQEPSGSGFKACGAEADRSAEKQEKSIELRVSNIEF